MKVRLLLFSAAALLLACEDALALKDHINVTPRNADGAGFTVTTAPQEDGGIQFTIVRDLSKSRSYAADSPLVVRRSADLRIYTRSGPLVECRLQPDKHKIALVYRFTIARELIAHSSVIVAEIDDYKDKHRERLLGGGTYFEFRLSDF